MSTGRSLVLPTANPALNQALWAKLRRRQQTTGVLGELEPLAVRLGLLQNTLKPRLRDPQLLVFAADHGLAVEGVNTPAGPPASSTADLVRQYISYQLPAAAFARALNVNLTVVDCGLAVDLPTHERLLLRKLAHGTRNCRVTAAMSVEQAHAGMRAGMEIGEKLPGNAALMAGVGVGAHESAALLVSRLTDSPVRELLISGPDLPAERLSHLLAVALAAQARHRDITEPVEALAAFGGFEVAVMVGAMLMCANKRRVLLVDGLPACAALMVAARIAPAVTDYCVFVRSHQHRGLDHALSLFKASALLELGLNATDGTGATLAWPFVRNAAALVTEVADGQDPGPSVLDEQTAEPEPFMREREVPNPKFGPSLY